jgi:protein-tyrosine-phosphatase
MRSVQDGDDNIWKQVTEELELAGITEDQVTENKTQITEWIIKALTGGAEHCSLISLSFHTARERRASSLVSFQTMNSALALAVADFPGEQFQRVVGCNRNLIREIEKMDHSNPEHQHVLDVEVFDNLGKVLRNIETFGTQDRSSLSYHEKITRKEPMIVVLERINNTLREFEMQTQAPSIIIDNPSPSSPIGFSSGADRSPEDLKKALMEDTNALHELFADMNAFILCQLEDALKSYVKDVYARKYPQETLESWDDLAAALSQDESLRFEDIDAHRQSLQSLLLVLMEEHSLNDPFLQIDMPEEVLDESSPSRHESSIQSPHIGSGTSRTSVSDIGNTNSISNDSATLSEPANKIPVISRFQRMAVVFVDWAGERRSPMAQAYLIHLKDKHDALANRFCRTTSAGLTAKKPGVPLCPGVDFMLRDYSITENFQHTSRRLELRDVENYEYVLCMDSEIREQILSQFPAREDIVALPPTNPKKITVREDIEDKVKLLGGFGSGEVLEIANPESINGEYWFQVGTRRIYPGYDRCFSEIKRCINDFVFAATGFDVNAQKPDEPSDEDSREVTPDASDDEDYRSALFADSPPYMSSYSRDPFEELNRAVTNCKL